MWYSSNLFTIYCVPNCSSSCETFKPVGKKKETQNHSIKMDCCSWCACPKWVKTLKFLLLSFWNKHKCCANRKTTSTSSLQNENIPHKETIALWNDTLCMRIHFRSYEAVEFILFFIFVHRGALCTMQNWIYRINHKTERQERERERKKMPRIFFNRFTNESGLCCERTWCYCRTCIHTHLHQHDISIKFASTFTYRLLR